MDSVALLPPHAHLDQEAVQCVAQASSRYQVPQLLLNSILLKENGRTGKCSRENANGTRDCGLAQVNTQWVPYFEKQGITSDVLFGNACTNIHASAYILRLYYQKKEFDWFKAVVAYNIGPYNWTDARLKTGYAYATDVVKRWWSLYDWVRARDGAWTPGAYTGSQVP